MSIHEMTIGYLLTFNLLTLNLKTWNLKTVILKKVIANRRVLKPQKIKRATLALALLATTVSAIPFMALASPWIETGNARTRHHIHYLVDSGALNIPTSTWPLAWVSVKQAIESVDTATLTHAQAWSLQYLKHELQKAMAGAYTQSRSHYSASVQALEGFESTSREAREIETGITYTGNTFAMKLTGTYVDDPSDNKSARADGSFLAFLTNNWAVGVGAVNQWWGPGWHNSMILSNNARPAPGLFLKRNQTHAFATPALSWLGQWQFTAFANQLQDKTGPIEKPLLLGARFSATPLQSLEIGFSRLGIRNGEAKTASHVSHRSEQNYAITAIDARYGFTFGSSTMAAYGQIASQAGYHQSTPLQNIDSQNIPSQNTSSQNTSSKSPASQRIGMAGVEFSGVLFNTHHRIVFEGSNSTASFYQDQPSINTAYEHGRYQNGYRHLGRAIGASSDNDSEVISLTGQHYFDNGHHLSWRLAHANLNRDGSLDLNNLSVNSNVNTNAGTHAAVPVGGNAFGAKQTKVDNTQIQYRFPINDRLMVEIGGSYLSEPLILNDQEVKSSLHLSFFHHW